MTPFDPPVLHTQRLRMRMLDAQDAEALFAIFSDREVMRYWSTAPWSDAAEGEGMVAGDRDALARGTAIRYGLEERTSATLIGTVSLHAFDPANRRAEVGYALARSRWGQGLMHEALVVLIEHAFTALALHRLEADIDPRNAGSARSLERLGFVREGLLRERWHVGGEVSDTALYGLLRSDWKG